MTPADLLGTFITGVLFVAILSLILVPGSEAAEVLKAFGSSFSGIVDSAKKYPTK